MKTSHMREMQIIATDIPSLTYQIGKNLKSVTSCLARLHGNRHPIHAGSLVMEGSLAVSNKATYTFSFQPSTPLLGIYLDDTPPTVQKCM